MNERVAFGDDLNHFPQENTTILNSKFLILNSLDRARNRNLKAALHFCGMWYNIK